MKIKHILTILLISIGLIGKAQTFDYQLNYNNIKFGKSATGILQFNGLATFVNQINVPDLSLSDSSSKAVNSKWIKQQKYIDNKFKLFQDYSAYSVLRNLGFKNRNPTIVGIGDSNMEGYVDDAVGVTNNNWFNKLTIELQKIQGPNSTIGFTDFRDPTRYGITLSAGTSVLDYGPTKTGLFMNAGSTVTFTASANLVELWYWKDTSAGKLEFRRNGVLYRTIDASGTHEEGVPSFSNSPTLTPSADLASYEIKCIESSVFITGLFKSIFLASGDDTFYFNRAAVAGETFQSFDVSQIKKTTGLNLENEKLFLVALGTNSIYAPSKATSSTQFGIDLGLYIDSLNSGNNKMVYLIPPRTLETTYPAVLEPYINYYNVAIAKCLEKGVSYIDLNEIANNGIFGPDGLHYSLIGHKIIYSFVINKLAKLDLINSGVYVPYNGARGNINIGSYSITGSQFIGNSTSTTNWGTLPADFSSFAPDAGPSWLTGYSVVNGKVGAFNASQSRAFLDVPTNAMLSSGLALKANLAGGNTFTGVQTFSNGTVQPANTYTNSGFLNTLQSNTLTTNVNTYLPAEGGTLQSNGATGWAQYSSSTYTSGSPLVITAGNTTALANNGSTSITTQLPIGVTSFLNTSTGKILAQNDGDFYNIEVRFKAKSSSPNGRIKVGINIGGAQGVIREKRETLSDGVGVEQLIAIPMMVYSGSTFVANGGAIEVTSLVGDTTIYDVVFVIDRTHKAR